MKRTALALLVLVVMLPLSCHSVNEVEAETLGPPTFLSTQSAYPPDIVLISSPQNTTYHAHSILVNFTVTVPNAIYDVGYSFDNGSIQRITNLVKVSEVSVPYGTILLPPYIRVTYMGTFVLYGLSEGNHSVTIYEGYQYTGRWARYEIALWATAEFSIDTGPPILKILEIGTNTSSQQVPLNFTINEPASWMAYSLDQQTNITISGNTTLAGLSEGSHNLIVYANDTAGNMVSSQTIYFTVSIETQLQPEPFPTTLIIGSVVTVAVIGIGLMVYFKKRKSSGEHS